MVRTLPYLVLVLLLPSGARADHETKPGAEKPVGLLPGLGKHTRPIQTKSPEAQKFFDQGLVLLYGFNHAEAARSFRRAAEIDPQAVMPLWGLALALGPNYNRDIDPVGADRNKHAYEAAQKAVALSKADGVPEHERAYAQAIATRYSIDPKADTAKLEVAYKDAMKAVHERYPDDLDAATLYAEALMNLRPWKLWTKAGKPEEGTGELVRVLEEVLKRYPDHPGANHYYIHAVEASPTPERALPCATRLLTLVPAAGHLIHMPSHIWIHTGDYDLVAECNERAARADEEFMQRSGVKGVYTTMYYGHNLHFVVVAHNAQGKYEEAKRAAARLEKVAAPHVKEMPEMADYFTPVILSVPLRFGRWDDILAAPAPVEGLAFSRPFWHHARALAFLAKGRKEEAAKEREAFAAARARVPEKSMFGGNATADVLKVAAAVLDARLAGDPVKAVEHWRQAVAAYDDLRYAEPADWYYPVRESLGAALLQSGQAAEAEKVFREDLKRNRRNPRSLFGLMKSLEAQNRRAEAGWVRLEFERAWKGQELRLEDL